MGGLRVLCIFGYANMGDVRLGGWLYPSVDNLFDIGKATYLLPSRPP